LKNYIKNLNFFKLVLLVLLAIFAIYANLSLIFSHAHIVDNDFNQDILAAKSILSQKSPYDVWNNHPPFSSFLSTFFILDSDYYSFIFFGGFSLFILYVSTVYFISRTRTGLFNSLFYSALFLLSPFVLISSAHGAWSNIVTALVILFITAYMSRNLHMAGIFLAMASSIKIYPIFLLIRVIRDKNYLTLLTTLCTLLILHISYCLLISFDSLKYFFTNVAPNNFEKYRDFSDNFSIVGFSEFLWGMQGGWGQGFYPSASLLFLTVFFLSICIIYICLIPKKIILGLAITIIGMLLVSPISWIHYYSLLIIPIVLLMPYLRSKKLNCND
jgi:hypothetical protein